MASISLLSTEFSSISALHSSLTAQIQVTVERFPHKIAVSDEGKSLSYQQLWDQALVLSGALRNLPPQSLISIHGGVTTDHIVAIWATILGGHTYISFSPNASDSFCNLHLTHMGIRASIVIEGSHIEVKIDDEVIDQALSLKEIEAETRTQAHAACVVMTSGSTGKPKYVVFEDQHLIFESWRQNLDTGLSPEDKMDLLFSFHFSASLACIFPALLTGATLHLLDLRKTGWAVLPDWWRENKITVSNLSTSTYRKLIGSDHPVDVPDMKMLGVGAEAMNTHDVEGFLALFPSTCELQQSYASTEARTISQWLLRKHGWHDQDNVPVGHCVTGKHIEIMREDSSSATEGETGEIYVESAFIPDSYWNPELSTWSGYLNRHKQNIRRLATGDMGFFSPSGKLIITGRKDFQLKVRGHKVSPEWVENILTTSHEVPNQVTVAAHNEYGYVGILGPLVPDSAKPFIHNSVLSLPDYMRPSRWFRIREWPVNQNGKLDRRSIKSTPLEHSSLTPQSVQHSSDRLSPNTIRVMRIIQEVLALEEISPTADFFDELGGDSLNAVEVWGNVLSEFSVLGPYECMQQLRTPHAIGLWLDEQTESSAFVLLAEGKKDHRPIICLSPMGSGFNCYQPLVTCWNGDQSLLGFLTPFDSELKDLSILVQESLETLEARFPSGPIVLCGFSYAGVMVVEIGKKLLERGRHVDIILIDTPTYRPTSLWWKLVGYPIKRLKGKRKKPKSGRVVENQPVKIPYFYQQQLHLLRDFSPAMTNPTGMMIVFEALTKTQNGFHYKRDMNWEKWVKGEIRKYALPTTHNKIAKSPYIEEIARVIHLLINPTSLIDGPESNQATNKNHIRLLEPILKLETEKTDLGALLQE